MDHLQSTRMRHLLPALPYDVAALEPHINARTMMLHHDRHHAAYVEKLNTALDHQPALQEHTAIWLLQNLQAVPADLRTAVANNAGGHVNHSMLWRAMSPDGGEPGGELAAAIAKTFGSISDFKLQFDRAGEAVFGSGWVWLVRGQEDGGELGIMTTCGHENPLMQGHYPLFVNDVWEHAYYLKHENRRSEYLKGWWWIANWAEAARRFERSDLALERRWEGEGGLVDGGFMLRQAQ